jgi:hypothetical protein
MEHSNYSPSRLSRIINCPGSVGLINDLMLTKTIKAEVSSSYAEHGTMLHTVFERFYSGVNTGRWASGYEELDKNDQFLIRECVDYLEIILASIGHSNIQVFNESRVSMKAWGIPDVWGTSDYRIYDPIKRHIDVIDWKFGSGVPVYAKRNSQLMSYAAGAIGYPSIIQTIILHVVQPAIENFDTWTLTFNQLYEWVHGTLALAINKCTEEDAPLNPGIVQCRWCEGKNHCHARTDAVTDLAIRLFDAQKTLATCPKPEELIKILQEAPLVEKAIKDIVTYIQADMLKGIDYPTLKLVRGRANRKWKDEKEVVKWLSANTKIEDLYTSKIRSPSQFEKEVKTLKKNDQFNALYETPDGKITIANEKDKREAIKIGSKSPVNVFADYKGDPNK